jgi:hypothetical protein
MMYILKGQLPWLPPTGMEFKDAQEKKDYVIKQKKTIKAHETFIGYPSVFMKIYDYIQTVGYVEDPDYEV